MGLLWVDNTHTKFQSVERNSQADPIAALRFEDNQDI
jgi:hypothetical protein